MSTSSDSSASEESSDSSESLPRGKRKAPSKQRPRSKEKDDSSSDESSESRPRGKRKKSAEEQRRSKRKEPSKQRPRSKEKDDSSSDESSESRPRGKRKKSADEQRRSKRKETAKPRPRSEEKDDSTSDESSESRPRGKRKGSSAEQSRSKRKETAKQRPRSEEKDDSSSDETSEEPTHSKRQKLSKQRPRSKQKEASNQRPQSKEKDDSSSDESSESSESSESRPRGKRKESSKQAQSKEKDDSTSESSEEQPRSKRKEPSESRPRGKRKASSKQLAQSKEKASSKPLAQSKEKESSKPLAQSTEKASSKPLGQSKEKEPSKPLAQSTEKASSKPLGQSKEKEPSKQLPRTKRREEVAQAPCKRPRGKRKHDTTTDESPERRLRRKRDPVPVAKDCEEETSSDEDMSESKEDTASESESSGESSESESASVVARDASESRSAAYSADSVYPIPEESAFNDELLTQQPLDTRMFVFDPDKRQEPPSPCQANSDDGRRTNRRPWHAFALPLTKETYERSFSSTSEHYQHVLQRGIENFTHIKDSKVMSCGTEEMQRTLTKYVKLIVRYKTRPFFFVKSEKDCTMMYIPARCKKALRKMLPDLEMLTGTLAFLCDGPDIVVRDSKGRWRRGCMESWVDSSTLSVSVGSRQTAAEVSIDNVRSIKRDADDARPLALFAPDERQRLLCVAHVVRAVADDVDSLPSDSNQMFHPMISVRRYPANEEKLLLSISQKFEPALRAATNCAVLVARTHNSAILVGNAAEKQLCATYIHCMMESDVPSRPDALLIPRPDGFQSKLDEMIKVGESTKTLVFIKNDKVVVMSPCFVRRSHAFLRIAHILEEVDPGYAEPERLHMPVDSSGKCSVVEIKVDATQTKRRGLIEHHLENMGIAAGGAVAVLKDSIYAVGTDEALNTIRRYTQIFLANRPEKDVHRVPTTVEVPQSVFLRVAELFKVYTVPYLSRGYICLVGPSNALASAASALSWVITNCGFPPRKKRVVEFSLVRSGAQAFGQKLKRCEERVTVELAKALPHPQMPRMI